jgi:hypothetical protein
MFGDENIRSERSSYMLHLNIDEENYWEWEVPRTPYVFNENFIQFFPGETLFVEADVVDNIIVKLTVVKEIVNQEKTITINFIQVSKEENERVHNFMMMNIKNPFNKDMEYTADIYLLEHNKWVNTSTIPVRAKIESYESWPDIISTIVLHDFVLK